MDVQYRNPDYFIMQLDIDSAVCPEVPLQEPTQNPACEGIASYGSDSDSESD